MNETLDFREADGCDAHQIFKVLGSRYLSEIQPRKESLVIFCAETSQGLKVRILDLDALVN